MERKVLQISELSSFWKQTVLVLLKSLTHRSVIQKPTLSIEHYCAKRVICMRMRKP